MCEQHILNNITTIVLMCFTYFRYGRMLPGRVGRNIRLLSYSIRVTII